MFSTGTAERSEWDAIAQRLHQLKSQVKQAQSALAFAFIEVSFTLEHYTYYTKLTLGKTQLLYISIRSYYWDSRCPITFRHYGIDKHSHSMYMYLLQNALNFHPIVINIKYVSAERVWSLVGATNTKPDWNLDKLTDVFKSWYLIGWLLCSHKIRRHDRNIGYLSKI